MTVFFNTFQPPAATASFFERMKFIIEDQGLQSYVQRKGFNERSVRPSVLQRLFSSMSLQFPGWSNQIKRTVADFFRKHLLLQSESCWATLYLSVVELF